MIHDKAHTLEYICVATSLQFGLCLVFTLYLLSEIRREAYFIEKVDIIFRFSKIVKIVYAAISCFFLTTLIVGIVVVATYSLKNEELQKGFTRKMGSGFAVWLIGMVLQLIAPVLSVVQSIFCQPTQQSNYSDL